MTRAAMARRLGAATGVGAPGEVVVVAEREPEAFQARLAAAIAGEAAVFLADPAWGEAERQALVALSRRPAAEVKAGQTPAEGWLAIPTGGSSGGVKLARHDEQTLGAAAEAFRDFWAVDRVNAVGVLPLHHVSGLMAWLRTALTGGRYVGWGTRWLEAGNWPEVEGDNWFLSLVPTQLQRLLDQPGAVERLRRFRAVFVGGGPAWPELVERAAAARLPLAFTYGMTETAAMVTALRPEAFLAGQRGCGQPLPHARVRADEAGAIEVMASSLFRGYWPECRGPGGWSTADTGWFDEQGSLHLGPRADQLIITGGEKVDPAEVEAVLRATGEFGDVVVLGWPDEHWGQRVVAFHPAERQPDRARIEAALAARLAPFKRPKLYVAVPAWPRNEQGKVRRDVLRAMAPRRSG